MEKYPKKAINVFIKIAILGEIIIVIKIRKLQFQ